MHAVFKVRIKEFPPFIQDDITGLPLSDWLAQTTHTVKVGANSSLHWLTQTQITNIGEIHTTHTKDLNVYRPRLKDSD